MIGYNFGETEITFTALTVRLRDWLLRAPWHSSCLRNADSALYLSFNINASKIHAKKISRALCEFDDPAFCCFFFWKISLVFPRNNLKWKLILLLIFQHQSPIWQNSGSQVVGQNAVGHSNCRILWKKWRMNYISGIQINIDVFC